MACLSVRSRVCAVPAELAAKWRCVVQTGVRERGIPHRMLRRVLAGRRLLYRRLSRGHAPSVEADGSNETAQAAIELLQFGAFAVCVNNYVLASTQCVGPSMLPTISTAGDIVFMLPVSRFRWSATPQIGDVVVATSPTDPLQSVCKRLLGLPGDTIEVEPIPGLPHDCPRRVRIPEGRCWLQGDNIYDSTDSRFYGPVPVALIQAVVWFRVWPLSLAGFIPRMSAHEVATLHAPRSPRPAGASSSVEAPLMEAHPSDTAELPERAAAPAPKLSPRDSLAALIVRGEPRDARGVGAGGGAASRLAVELSLSVERARAQACKDGADISRATAPMQMALSKLFDSEREGGERGCGSPGEAHEAEGGAVA